MSTTTTRCWGFVHTNGPTKGDPYEYGEGAPHFPSAEAAIEWRDQIKQHPAVDLVQLPECHTVTCDGCGDPVDGEFGTIHHPTPGDAASEARDGGWTQSPDGSWRCPTCA